MYTQNYSRAPYRANNYSRNYNNMRMQQPKKRSGAKLKIARNGKPVVVAWKATKQGMLSILVAPTKYSKSVTSKSGRQWVSGCSVSIRNNKLMSTSLHWGLMEKSTGKTIVKDLGIVINPHGGLGGVVAQIGKKSR